MMVVKISAINGMRFLVGDWNIALLLISPSELLSGLIRDQSPAQTLCDNTRAHLCILGVLLCKKPAMPSLYFSRNDLAENALASILDDEVGQ